MILILETQLKIWRVQNENSSKILIEGGNTKAVAEIIAEVVNVVPETLDIPRLEYTDVLFLGSVYAWNTDEELTMYLQPLNNKQIGMIIDFSTAGGMSATNGYVIKGYV